jgi:hypothetical protein
VIFLCIALFFLLILVVASIRDTEKLREDLDGLRDEMYERCPDPRDP